MSIAHFEDIPPRKFLAVMQDFWEYEATEKLDGSQLLFGIDEKGFYTSRESKGGTRIYNVDNYELTFKNTYIRSAHIALESSLSLLKEAGLKIDCQVEIEVLYGEYPNVIQYSPDTCFIIFLRTTKGSVNIDELRVKLEGQTLTFPLLVPFTEDGKDINYKTVVNDWKFSSSPTITIPRSLEIDLRECEKCVSRALMTPYNDNISILEFLETPMNRRPYWTDPAENWNFARSNYIDSKYSIMSDIRFIIREFKEVMLDKLVRTQASKFGPANGWIEGIVFRHPTTGHMFKLVDKDIFLKVKDFYWKERNQLFKLAKSGYNTSDLDNRLDKYEKDRSTSQLTLQTKGSPPIGKKGKTIYFNISEDVDTRTKEIFATLYQQKANE